MVVSIAEDKNHVPKILTAIHDNLTGRTSLATANEVGMSTFTAEYTSNQTDQDIITPSSGTIELDFPTSNKPIWRHYASKFSQAGAWKLNLTGAADEPVRLNTTTGSEKVFIMINYRETD